MSLTQIRYRTPHEFESRLEYEMYMARIEMEERSGYPPEYARQMPRPKIERELYMDEIRSLETKNAVERDSNIKLSKEITTLNERIKYLEEAILELEGDKNA